MEPVETNLGSTGTQLFFDKRRCFKAFVGRTPGLFIILNKAWGAGRAGVATFLEFYRGERGMQYNKLSAEPFGSGRMRREP